MYYPGPYFLLSPLKKKRLTIQSDREYTYYHLFAIIGRKREELSLEI